ncbi:MAG: ATP-binding protein [Clostridiales bacterium]|jgi:hypothetical protein|nr:ATP-binding protein [Clostridiales bacterium]
MKIEENMLTLINLKQEGDYWDFKREWYHEDVKADLLHDIICMANNLADKDAYIIIGVDEMNDFSLVNVTDQAERKNTDDIVTFLRDKKFLGGIRPTVFVDNLTINGVAIDVIVIKKSNNTPFVLAEKFQCVKGGHIYTRIQDTNTPKDKTADLDKQEYLWRKRFGIEKPALERLSILLSDYKNWECNLMDKHYGYHKIFPEFRFEYEELNANDEPISYFYTNPKCFFGKFRLLYHQTILWESHVYTFDEMRIALPQFRIGLINMKEWFYYYILNEFEGKLLKIFNYSEYNRCYPNRDLSQKRLIAVGGSRSSVEDSHYFCVFNTADEKEDFIQYCERTISNFPDKDLELHYFEAFHNYSEEKVTKDTIIGIAKVIEIYKQWLSDRTRGVDNNG